MSAYVAGQVVHVQAIGAQGCIGLLACNASPGLRTTRVQKGLAKCVTKQSSKQAGRMRCLCKEGLQGEDNTSIPCL